MLCMYVIGSMLASKCIQCCDTIHVDHRVFNLVLLVYTYKILMNEQREKFDFHKICTNECERKCEIH